MVFDRCISDISIPAPCPTTHSDMEKLVVSVFKDSVLDMTGRPKTARPEKMLVDAAEPRQPSTLKRSSRSFAAVAAGRLSSSPLDNFMRLRGYCSPIKACPPQLPTQARKTGEVFVPLPLQSSVTAWHTSVLRALPAQQLAVLCLPPLTETLRPLVLLMAANSAASSKTLFLCDSDEQVSATRQWVQQCEEVTGAEWASRLVVANSKKQFIYFDKREQFAFAVSSAFEWGTTSPNTSHIALLRQLLSDGVARHALLLLPFRDAATLRSLEELLAGCVCFGTPLHKPGGMGEGRWEVKSAWASRTAQLSETELQALAVVKADPAAAGAMFCQARDSLMWHGSMRMVEQVAGQGVPLQPATEAALTIVCEEREAGILPDHSPLCDAVLEELSSNPPMLGSKAVVVVAPVPGLAETCTEVLKEQARALGSSDLRWGAITSSDDEAACNCFCTTTSGFLKLQADFQQLVSVVVLVAYPPSTASCGDVFELNEVVSPVARRCVVVLQHVAAHRQAADWWTRRLSAAAAGEVLLPRTVLGTPGKPEKPAHVEASRTLFSLTEPPLSPLASKAPSPTPSPVVVVEPRSSTRSSTRNISSRTDDVLNSIMHRSTVSRTGAGAAQPHSLWPSRQPVTRAPKVLFGPQATAARPPTTHMLSCCLPRGASRGQTELCWVPTPQPQPQPQPPQQRQEQPRQPQIPRAEPWSTPKPRLPSRVPPAAGAGRKELTRKELLQRLSDFFSYREE